MTPPKTDSVAGQSEPRLPAWAEGRFTLEELKRMAEDDDESGCLELKNFLEELNTRQVWKS
ncbi:MAG: hypothetical protein L0215_16690 [Gemmataceae bacterium]|nr:hypothetical protein [Gemmataceae bacterium]